MKKGSIVVLFIFSALWGFSQLREVKNEAFQRGEMLIYKAYYDSFITGEVLAGGAVFEVKNEDKKINDRSTLHLSAIGKTRGAFNWFYKVVDRYESYIDEKALVPWLFIRRVNEGGYIIQQDVIFNQIKNEAFCKNLKKNTMITVPTPEYIHDVLSAIYYCRVIDYNSMKVNDEFYVKFLLDDTVWTTKVIYLGKETLDVGIGKVKCIKIKPQVLVGNVFKEPFPVTVWVSDDKNKIPIIAESAIIVGSVKLELIDFSGLKNPFSALQ